MALKNLFQNKLKALTIAIPLTLIIAIVSAVSFFMEGVERDALLAAHFFPDVLVQQQVGGRTESLFFERYEDSLKEIKGVKSFFPRAWGYINHLDSENKRKAFVVMGLDPAHISSGLMIDPVIEKGRNLKISDSGRGIIGKAMARAFSCGVGDTIEITSPDLRKKTPIEVVGIFAASVQIYTADLLLVDLETARTILGFYEQDECSDILLYLNNPSMADTVSRQITANVEGARPLTKPVMLSLTRQSFGQKSGIFHLLWFILLVNLIIIAWSLMSQISFNLKKEIGILKAIGWDTADIMELKTMETFLTGALAVTSGILLGILYMLVDAPGLKRLIIGWADIYPDFPIPLYIEGATVLVIIVLGIFPLLAGTLVPVWRIGTIDPDEAIRT